MTTEQLLTEPLPGEDLAKEIEQAGKPVGKWTIALIAVALVAAGFAGGVWAGRASSSSEGPAAVSPSQNGGRFQQGGYPGGGLQQGTFPGTGARTSRQGG